MAKKQKTGGRKAGTPNKTTVEVKEALELVFEKIGGVEKLAEWAGRNREEFYKLWAKLLPKDINAKVSSRLTISWPLPKGPLDQ